MGEGAAGLIVLSPEFRKECGGEEADGKMAAVWCGRPSIGEEWEAPDSCSSIKQVTAPHTLSDAEAFCFVGFCLDGMVKVNFRATTDLGVVAEQ